MKKWYVGVDGGGTKTAFAISTNDGAVVMQIERSGCSYQMIGIAGTVSLIATGIRECLAAVDATLDDCAGCCLGVPCYGESGENDVLLMQELRKALAPAPIYLVNDVEVGWAGSLGGLEGIHVVAGTGSIAYGRGTNGVSARCGGWSEFFGDEGSCYWVGRETMSLFTKQADGRVPCGPLYATVKEMFGITNDISFNDFAIEHLIPYRDKVASFQLAAKRAAELGDLSARDLYERAAHELALMVKALKNKLFFAGEKVPVSYSGGLFKAGELILAPFRQEVERLGCSLCAPLMTAVEGALLLAIERFCEEECKCT